MFVRADEQREAGRFVAKAATVMVSAKSNEGSDNPEMNLLLSDGTLPVE